MQLKSDISLEKKQFKRLRQLGITTKDQVFGSIIEGKKGLFESSAKKDEMEMLTYSG